MIKYSKEQLVALQEAKADHIRAVFIAAIASAKVVYDDALKYAIANYLDSSALIDKEGGDDE